MEKEEENGYNHEGEGQTNSGPVVMLQAERGRSAGEYGRDTGTSSYDNRKGTVWRNGNGAGSPQSGKEEKLEEREEGESRRETTDGPILMLNTRLPSP